MRITSFTTILGALIASAALAACGDSGEQSPPASESADAETSATETSGTESAPAESMDGGDAGSMDEPAAEPMEEPAEAPAEEAPAEADAQPAEDGGEAASGGDGEFLIAGLTGDPEAGRRVFARCRSCHVLEEGVNRVGPSLNGIIGREAGSVEGFRYSEANANSGITWTEENFFEYLENPREYIPGTIMAFPGLRDPQDRADVIAYIKANGGDA